MTHSSSSQNSTDPSKNYTFRQDFVRTFVRESNEIDTLSSSTHLSNGLKRRKMMKIINEIKGQDLYLRMPSLSSMKGGFFRWNTVERLTHFQPVNLVDMDGFFQEICLQSTQHKGSSIWCKCLTNFI